MQSLLEATNHIANEIERTRQHLRNLEQALEGLRPLITVDVFTAPLPYVDCAAPQSVEDISEVVPERPATIKPAIKPNPKATAKSKATATELTKFKKQPVTSASAEHVPATGAKLWAEAMGRKKLSLEGLTTAALSELKLDVSGRAPIKNRARVWLHAAVRKGVVKASHGRDGTNLYQMARG